MHHRRPVLFTVQHTTGVCSRYAFIDRNRFPIRFLFHHWTSVFGTDLPRAASYADRLAARRVVSTCSLGQWRTDQKINALLVDAKRRETQAVKP